MNKFELSLVFVILPLSIFTAASPTVSLPINAQVPPVAQVGEQYDFTFSYATFSSQSAITYSLTSAPSWLQIDSAGRRLLGQPTISDEGSHEFVLVATDFTGSSDMQVTLVVTSSSGPTVGASFQQQLSDLGTFQSPQALLFYPEAVIDLQFAADTFQETHANTQFYAVGVNSTPLPPWLQFDPRTLSFHGKTPAFTSSTELPQDIDVTFVASDIPGFSQAAAHFRITVESHELVFTGSNYTIEAVADRTLSYTALAGSLEIDGQIMPLSNVTSVSADQPSWLQLDTTTLTLTGQVPSNIESSNFTLTVADSVGDTATATIQIVAPGNVSTTNLILHGIAPINVTIGSFFHYTFDRDDFAQSIVSLTIDTGNASSWLRFDNASLLLSGIVPVDSREQPLSIYLAVSEGGRSQSEEITLNLIKSYSTQASATVVSTVSASTATQTATPSSTLSTSIAGAASSSSLCVILPAVLCPTIALLSALLLFCFLRRRKHKKDINRFSRRLDFQSSAVQHGPTKDGKRPAFRTHSMFREGSIFGKGTGQVPLLPPSATGAEKSPSRSSQRGIILGGSVTVGRQAPVRPPRPPSGAPQITRAILERDPDPLAEFREEHQLVESPRPDSIMLPEPPVKSLLRNRSQSEPHRQSYRRSRASISSFLDRAANNRLSAILNLARSQESSHSDTELSGVRRASSQPQSTYTSFFDSLDDGTAHYDFQDQTDSDNSRRHAAGSAALTASGEWTTTSGSAMDPLATCSSGDANRNTSSTINGFFAQSSPQRRATTRQTDAHFANTTIRGVTPSMSTLSASNPSSAHEGHSRRASLLAAKRTSQSSIDRKRHSTSTTASTSSRPRSSYSPQKPRRSRIHSQYGDYLKLRRQGPATHRFSSAGLYRKPSSAYRRSSSLLDSAAGSSTPETEGETDKENAGLTHMAGSPAARGGGGGSMVRERKRSRGSIQRLGRQMQMQMQQQQTPGPAHGLPFARMASTRSVRSVASTSASASDISFRTIEEEVMAQVQDNARYWRDTRQGGRRRSSLHRLSALPESQGQGHAGEGFRVFEGLGTPVLTMAEGELPVSRSFRGELGEWKTDDEGSVATGRTGAEGGDYFPVSSPPRSEGSTSKMFI